MFRNLKVLFIVFAVMIVAGLAYAFAAANTIPDTAAGSGVSTVSGYTVSNIVYDLDAADPTILDAITFTVTPDDATHKALFVYVQTEAAGVWTSCSLVDNATPPAVDATCTFGALPIEDVTALNVVANGTTDPTP